MNTMTATRPIRIALYDDNCQLRISMAGLFSAFPEFHFLGAYQDAVHILDNCRYQPPDVILMDIDMPQVSGIEAMQKVKAHFPDIKVLMLTVFDDNEKIFESICHGAVGYMLKSATPMDLLEAIKDAYEGGAPLTNSIASKVLRMFREQAPPKEENTKLNDREKEILTYLTRGLSYKMIAAECDIKIDTVRFHIKKIYEKLHVHSMTEAVSKALKNKWV